MRTASLVLVVDEAAPDLALLLGKKVTGAIGCGKFNAPGGKCEEEELPAACAVRELAEEVGLVVNEADLQHVATLYCYVGNVASELALHQKVFVYRATTFHGLPVITDSMEPQWFSLQSLPYERMHGGDSAWIADAARGRQLVASIFFEEPGERCIRTAIRYGNPHAPPLP